MHGVAILLPRIPPCQAGVRLKLNSPGFTDADGRIFIYPDVTAEKIVVSHGNLFAEVPLTRLTHDFVVELQPEASLKGTLRIGGQPWAYQLLGLCHPRDQVQNPSFAWSHLNRTDEHGRYHFPEAERGLWDIWLRTPRLPEGTEAFLWQDRLLPAEYPFGRKLARVEIFDRETVEANIQKQGRILTGRVVVANPVRPVDLRASRLIMYRDSKTLAGLTGAHVLKDGSFTIPCLEPGDYQMHLTVEGYPAASPTTGFEGIIGSAERRDLTVTTNLNDGVQPLNLGEIPVTLREPLFLGERVVEFEALTLEGNTLRLADWLGQPLLLIFGYPGLYHSTRGELTRFDEWYRGPGELERPAVISLCLGGPEELEWMREANFPCPPSTRMSNVRLSKNNTRPHGLPISYCWMPKGVSWRGTIDSTESFPLSSASWPTPPLDRRNLLPTGSPTIWLIYADSLGAEPPSTWPKEPEFAGGILAYFEIDWCRQQDGGIEVTTRHKTPPRHSGFDWARWVGAGVPDWIWSLRSGVWLWMKSRR